MLRLRPLHQLLLREVVLRLRRHAEQPRQLRLSARRGPHLGGQPEEDGDDVVGSGEAAGLRLRGEVAVADGGDGDEGEVERVDERVLDHTALRVGEEAYGGGFEAKRTAEGEDEENELGDGDHDLAFAALHEGLLPELHVAEEEEEEEGAQLDHEEVHQEVLLRHDRHHDHRETRQEVEAAVATMKGSEDDNMEVMK